MPYLIDGHNLIGQLPDIDLADPDDEVKLVLKLRSFAARISKKVTVVFDHGIPAGVEKGLSTHSVTVRFASRKSSADNVIKQVIRNLKNPSGWILVSSDRDVRDLASQRKMKIITSHDFVARLQSNARPKSAKKRAQSVMENTPKTNPHLSAAEVDEWLEIFQSAAENDD